MEAQQDRKPHVILAFIAGLLGTGLGYVYVGRLRLGFATVAALCSIVCLFSWSRLIVRSATMLWTMTAILILIGLFALIHPIVLAARGEVSAKRYNRVWVYISWSVASIALGPILYLSRSTVLGYGTFRIPTSSMSPTVKVGDYVLTDSWRYKTHPVSIGEIVIIERPEDPGVKYIKRVVATGGDRIEIRDGHLYRNGERVAESYIHPPLPYSGSPRTVPPTTLAPDLIHLRPWRLPGQ